MSWLQSTLARNKAACLQLRNRWYPESEWPSEIYLSDIREHAGEALLEIGCGRRPTILTRARDCFQRRVGLDPDLAGVESDDPSLELLTGDASTLPFDNESFDVVAMNNVAEHLEHPADVLAECARVLRPRGKLIIQTVNQAFLPIVLARWMPHRLRVTLNYVVSGTEHDDTFPTYYRANTMKKLRLFAEDADLRPVRMRYLSHHPHYFLFSTWAYRAAVLLERPVRRLPALKRCRHFLHVILEKPAVQTAPTAPPATQAPPAPRTVAARATARSA